MLSFETFPESFQVFCSVADPDLDLDLKSRDRIRNDRWKIINDFLGMGYLEL
jgi:hypothetical protein